MKPTDTSATVHTIKRMDDRGDLLQQELYAVICQEKFNDMKLSTTIGILEFLKWNLINRA